MVNVFTKSIPMRLALSLLIIFISINVLAESISTSRLNSHSSNSVYSLSSLNMDKPIVNNDQNFSKEKNDEKKKQDVDVEKDDAVLVVLGKRVRDAAFFLIIMLVTFAATLLKPQKYVSSRTIQKCVEHVSTST